MLIADYVKRGRTLRPALCEIELGAYQTKRSQHLLLLGYFFWGQSRRGRIRSAAMSVIYCDEIAHAGAADLLNLRRRWFLSCGILRDLIDGLVSGLALRDRLLTSIGRLLCFLMLCRSSIEVKPKPDTDDE